MVVVVVVVFLLLFVFLAMSWSMFKLTTRLEKSAVVQFYVRWDIYIYILPQLAGAAEDHQTVE